MIRADGIGWAEARDPDAKSAFQGPCSRLDILLRGGLLQVLSVPCSCASQHLKYCHYCTAPSHTSALHHLIEMQYSSCHIHEEISIILSFMILQSLCCDLDLVFLAACYARCKQGRWIQLLVHERWSCCQPDTGVGGQDLLKHFTL